jgi:hypothetical protein
MKILLMIFALMGALQAQQIGDMPSAGTMSNGDLFVIVQGYTGSSGTGANYKLTFANLKTAIGSSSYTLPAATTTTLGGLIVPVSGGLGVDGSGNLSIVHTPWATVTGAPSFLTANQTITLSSDVTGSGVTGITATVKGINGQLLSSLSTGILKNTTTTGVPTIATAHTDYEVPVTFSGGLTRTSNNVAANIGTDIEAWSSNLDTLSIGDSANAGYVATANSDGSVTFQAAGGGGIPQGGPLTANLDLGGFNLINGDVLKLQSNTIHIGDDLGTMAYIDNSGDTYFAGSMNVGGEIDGSGTGLTGYSSTFTCAAADTANYTVNGFIDFFNYNYGISGDSGIFLQTDGDVTSCTVTSQPLSGLYDGTGLWDFAGLTLPAGGLTLTDDASVPTNQVTPVGWTKITVNGSPAWLPYYQ